MGICQQVALIWPADQQDTAQAICMAESGGDPNAHCFNCAGVPENSVGLFQINLNAHPDLATQDVYDPTVNAQAAYDLWKSSGWSPWSTYTNGAYRKYLTGSPSSPSGTTMTTLIGTTPTTPPASQGPEKSQLVAFLVALVALRAIIR